MNIKIWKFKTRDNLAYYDPETDCMYIKKYDNIKNDINYADYSIDIINHEFMHSFLFREFGDNISRNYHEVSVIMEEDFRKLLIYDQKSMKSIIIEDK